MVDLKAQEVFAVGSWNGTQFSEADLDAMVTSFDALGLTGRVPLKFGHDSPKPDGQPALGWVSRVWREGSKLLADFSSVPDKVMGLIRDKAYRFVSVELLKNVRAGTRNIPWVLDAVALLGADQPAVGILKELTMSARAGLRFEARVAFTRESTLKSGEHRTMDYENLRAENARLQLQLAEQHVEAAITAGRCMPYVREIFRKASARGAGTLEFAQQVVKENPITAAQRSKFAQRPSTRVESETVADGDDELGDAFTAAAAKLGIKDYASASANDQRRVWLMARKSAPGAYERYVSAPGAV